MLSCNHDQKTAAINTPKAAKATFIDAKPANILTIVGVGLKDRFL
jgi:hypothetical protein